MNRPPRKEHPAPTVSLRLVALLLLVAPLVAAALSVPCALVSPAAAQAAGKGRVIGRVLASDTGSPVPYADISLIPADSTIGRRTGVLANEDGTFMLETVPGVYNLQIRAISYTRRLVTGLVVQAGQVRDVSVTISPEALKQAEIVVEAKAIQSSDAAILAQRKRSASVGDAISAEQVKKSPDRDAGDVLRRVTGTSLVDGKFVYVRGMGERYSSTEMDGVRIASPEQNKRVVPLDMIPSSLLDNVVVQKTYTADRPGEFGGGDVQIRTKDFPGKRTLAVSLGTGYDSETSFQDVMGYSGSSKDRFALGAGSRALPDEIDRYFGNRRAGPGGERAPYDSTALAGAAFQNQLTPRSERGRTPTTSSSPTGTSSAGTSALWPAWASSSRPRAAAARNACTRAASRT